MLIDIGLDVLKSFQCIATQQLFEIDKSSQWSVMPGMLKLSIIINGGALFKNGIGAVHLAEILHEDYLQPLEMSANEQE